MFDGFYDPNKGLFSLPSKTLFFFQAPTNTKETSRHSPGEAGDPLVRVEEKPPLDLSRPGKAYIVLLTNLTTSLFIAALDKAGDRFGVSWRSGVVGCSGFRWFYSGF